MQRAKPVHSLACIACLTLGCGLAWSADFDAELVEQVSGWDIRIDAGDKADGKVAKRCFMQRDFDSGIRFQIGLWPARDGAFVAAYSKEWDDIHAGEEAEIDFDFGSDLFAGTVTGEAKQGYFGGATFTNNPEFLSQFQASKTLLVGDPRDEMLEIPLTGTKKAFDAVRACQERLAEGD